MTPSTVQVGTPGRDASHRFAITLTRGDLLDVEDGYASSGAGRWAETRAPRRMATVVRVRLATRGRLVKACAPVQAFEPRLTAELLRAGLTAYLK